MNCKNCNREVHGNFCSHCGQSSKIKRINLSNFLSEVSASLFQVNKGFFFTQRELFVRPGKSLEEFLNGKRKNHFKPIAYALTLSTLYFLIVQLTQQNTWMDDAITGWMNAATEIDSTLKVPKMGLWLAKNYAYSTLLLLPVFSLASYLSFFPFKKNYLEHIVVNAYITGHQALLYSIFALIGTIVEFDLLESLPLLVAVAYTFWVFWQLFSDGNRFVNILRSALTYLLYFIFSVGVLMTLIVIGETYMN